MKNSFKIKNRNSQSTKIIKPQRFTVKPLILSSLIKENQLNLEQKKLLTLDKKLVSLSHKIIPKIIKKNVLKNPKKKKKSLYKNSLGKKSRVLFDEIFLKKFDKDLVKNLEILKNDKNDNFEKIDYDEGLKKIKEVTKKRDNYKIYDKKQKKSKIKTKTKISNNSAIFKIKKKQKKNLNLKKKKNKIQKEENYFSNQIQLEIPNILGSNELINKIPILLDSGINKKILKNFNKNDILIKMNTNVKKEDNHHDFQLIFYLALTYEKEENFKTSIIYYKKFLEYAFQIENKNCISFCFNRIGINFFKLKKYNKCFDNHFKNLEFVDDDKIFVVFYNLGLVLRFLKNFKESINFFEKCQNWSLKKEDKRGIAISLAQKGICFYEQKFYKKAKDFLEVN